MDHDKELHPHLLQGSFHLPPSHLREGLRDHRPFSTLVNVSITSPCSAPSVTADGAGRTVLPSAVRG
jgi:hypothetical protein